MSKYGWNSASRIGHVQHMPQSPPQIACRLCDQIFMGSRALMHHLESHVTEDGTISTRQQEFSFMTDSVPTPLKEIRPSVQNRHSPVQNPAAGNRNPAAWFDFPPLQLPIGRNNPSTRPQPAKQRATKQLSSDFIKPYIDLLDKPIPEIVELNESDDDEKKLDLTLKL